MRSKLLSFLLLSLASCGSNPAYAQQPATTSFAGVFLADLAQSQEPKAMPQPTPKPSLAVSKLSSPEPSAFVIQKTDKVILAISMEGVITFGEGVTPSDAAKEFAAYLKFYMAQSKEKETK